MVILDPQNSTGIAFKYFTYQLVLGGWGFRISEVEGIAQKCILFTQPVIKSIFNLWGWQMIQLKWLELEFSIVSWGNLGLFSGAFTHLLGFVFRGSVTITHITFPPLDHRDESKDPKTPWGQAFILRCFREHWGVSDFFWIYRWYRLVIYAMTPKSVVRAANSLTKGNLN